jgi:hypothetical protein
VRLINLAERPGNTGAHMIPVRIGGRGVGLNHPELVDPPMSLHPSTTTLSLALKSSDR